MSELEIQQLKEYKKYLRLSSERNLYTIPQAAFRLNCSRNVFNSKYVETGKIKLVVDDGKLMVPATELLYAISELPKVVHTNSVKRVKKVFLKELKSDSFMKRINETEKRLAISTAEMEEKFKAFGMGR